MDCVWWIRAQLFAQPLKTNKALQVAFYFQPLTTGHICFEYKNVTVYNRRANRDATEVPCY